MTSPRKDDDPQLELGAGDSIIALRKAWDRTLRAIATKVSKMTFESFFRSTQALAIDDDDVVVIGAPSRFIREWLEKRYADNLRTQLRLNLGNPRLQLRFVLSSPDARPAILGEPVYETIEAGGAGPEPAAEPVAELVPVRKKADRWPVTSGGHRCPLPPDLAVPPDNNYTFDTFIVGKSNRLAHAGALAVADHPGTTYNPLFLYGQPGLGKTHLMLAIGNRIRERNPGASVAFVSGESFTNGYITALRQHKSDDFRAVYRNVDVWLVDDIQTIAGKEHTKEEFFHTFNTLHQMNKQIVLSSDKSPRELRLMDERLRSRFECGLIADVAPPELEMRVAILQQKATREGLDIPGDVLMYMANLIQSNIRSLEGALIRLMACASVAQTAVTKQLAREVLGGYFVDRTIVYRAGETSVATGDREEFDNETPSGLRALPIPQSLACLNSGNQAFEHIVQTVAAYFSLDPHLIAGPGSAITSRKRTLAKPRQVAIYIARERANLQLNELGHLFGGIGHSAISHAHGKIAEQITTDPRLLGIINEISSRL